MTNGIDKELGELRERLKSMSYLTCDRMQAAIEAWQTNDLETALSIKHADADLNEMELQILEHCETLISQYVLFGPARREVLTVMRLASLLERIGDTAVSLGKRQRKIDDLGRGTIEPTVLSTLTEMMSFARATVEQTSNLIAYFDVEQANEIVASDKKMNAANKEIFAQLADVDHADDSPEASQVRLHVLVLARKLEECGDLTKRIAEEVLFALSGTSARHH